MAKPVLYQAHDLVVHQFVGMGCTKARIMDLKIRLNNIIQYTHDAIADTITCPRRYL
jgi:hypothetical protein